MTASTHKCKRKRRKNKLKLFAGVLAGVLAFGGVLLTLLGMLPHKTALEKNDGQDRQRTESQREENLFAQIVKMEENLLGGGETTLEELPGGRYDDLKADEEQMREQGIYALEAASPERIVLDFAGDILFDKNYAMMATLKNAGGAIESVFSGEILEEMRGADLFMVNNEFPYSERGAPLPEKQFTFRASPDTASYLQDMGVDLVSLANNHAFDYGEQAFLDTLDVLKALPMPYVGAGRNLSEAMRPASFIINDTKISILSATQIERNDNPDTRGATESLAGTFRCWNPARLLEQIEEVKKDCDYLIVYIHWGTENQDELDWAQRDQAVMIADAGADLIIGDHPHCLQPVGYVNGTPVIYSLGNFWFNSRPLDTCIAQAVIEPEKGLSVRIIPARQENCRTALLYGADKARVIDYLNGISPGAYLDEEGRMYAK